MPFGGGLVGDVPVGRVRRMAASRRASEHIDGLGEVKRVALPERLAGGLGGVATASDSFGLEPGRGGEGVGVGGAGGVGDDLGAVGAPVVEGAVGIASDRDAVGVDRPVVGEAFGGQGFDVVVAAVGAVVDVMELHGGGAAAWPDAGAVAGEDGSAEPRGMVRWRLPRWRGSPAGSSMTVRMSASQASMRAMSRRILTPDGSSSDI